MCVLYLNMACKISLIIGGGRPAPVFSLLLLLSPLDKLTSILYIFDSMCAFGLYALNTHILIEKISEASSTRPCRVTTPCLYTYTKSPSYKL